VEAMEQIVRGWRPDMILREPWEFLSGGVAVRLGIPDAQVATSLAWIMWEKIEQVAPQLEAFQTGLADELRCSPFLTRLPTLLDTSPFPATWRYHEPAAVPGGRLPPWWADSSGPLLYVSLGTVVGRGSSAAEVYRAVIDVVARFDARVLVTVGRDFDASQLQGVPGNVHVEAWVDQADVLGEARLIICHGGSGTVYGALAVGVPLVIIPMFADQFGNAAAIAAAGAGRQIMTSQVTLPGSQRNRAWREVMPEIRRAIETGLGDAIEAVLGDDSYRQTAQAVAAEMAAAPTIGDLLDRLPRRRATR
jgi:UDP:flavonoid glycosyltransferase YjiC (YdhE family)